MTPFQRQVVEAEMARQAREQEERMEEARNGGGQTPPSSGDGRAMNSRAGGNSRDSHQQSETVRYINRAENPDYEFDE